MSKSTKDLLQGFGKSWSAESVGEFIRFKVKSTDVKQQTDDDGNPKTFDNGDPMYMIIAEVEDIDDPAEDKSVWFSGGKFTALKKALLELPEDQQDIEAGDSGVLTMTGQHKPKKASHTGAKIYEVTGYKKGSKTAAALGKAAPAPAASTATQLTAHGPKPDNIDDTLWSALDDKAKAVLSPPVEDDGRPDNVPADVWAKLPESAKAGMRKPKGPERPDFIPASVWSMMTDEQKTAAVD